MANFFLKAKPIFLKGLCDEMNIQARFCATLTYTGGACKMTLTAADLYSLSVNGKFVAYGPARTAHGYARVDEIDLVPYLTAGKNEIALSVAGYSCASFYTIRQRSFLLAEVCGDGGEVLLATGYDFAGYRDTRRAQRVMRYSFQRTFSEVWDYTKPLEATETEVVDVAPVLLSRVVPYPDFTYHPAEPDAYRGHTVAVPDRPVYSQRFIDFDLEPENRHLTGFLRGELEVNPYDEMQKLDYVEDGPCTLSGCRLEAGQYVFMRMRMNRTGFLQIRLRSTEGARFHVTFDEKMTNRTIDYKEINMINMVDFRVGAGQLFCESFEAYGFMYACLTVTEGSLVLDGVGVRGYVYPLEMKKPDFPDKALCPIYTAAMETFRQNAVDLFTDCPTRERAGWLCDSYFTSRAEMELTGDNPVERAFMENFRLYTPKWGIPAGMLPMCYPSDHEDGIYIPQWAMWYVLELEEFLDRTPSVDKEDYRTLCYDLLAYFKQYENADGLLEKLPSWNFVEWSRANDWTHDVNYPTNMLYVGTLRAIANIFGDEALREKSNEVEKTVTRLGFNGEYFFDHAVRNEKGVLQNVEDHVSETAQYYALKFFRIQKDDARYAALIRAVLEDFRTGAEIRMGDRVMEPSNAFIGRYLRLEILHRWGEYRTLKRDILDMFGGMAEATGTLWENKDTSGSLNHGFTSFVTVLLNHTPKEFLV